MKLFSIGTVLICVFAFGSLFLVWSCNPPKESVGWAMQGETHEIQCERLKWLSDERIHWETRRKARSKALDIGCLEWKD